VPVSAQSATLAGRAAAERIMVDTCTITRVTGTSTDPDTGVITPTLTTIYTGKCRIKGLPVASAGRVDVGEASLVLAGYALQLPIAATGVLVDDQVQVIASVLDPGLPGRRFFVVSPAVGTHLTARRLQIREVDS
jgi:hypothetical protein